MFSLHDIDDQIVVFTSAAEEVEAKAEGMERAEFASLLRCHASALRECAASLGRMIERAVEAQAREALR